MKCFLRAWRELKRVFVLFFFNNQLSPRLFYHTTLVIQWVPVADVPFYVSTTFANGFSWCSVSVW